MFHVYWSFFLYMYSKSIHVSVSLRFLCSHGLTDVFLSFIFFLLLWCLLPSSQLCGSDLLPVMVFIHGGGFILGSPDYAGGTPMPLLTKDIVLVSLQYRLGTLGRSSVRSLFRWYSFLSILFYFLFINSFAYFINFFTTRESLWLQKKRKKTAKSLPYKKRVDQ